MTRSNPRFPLRNPSSSRITFSPPRLHPGTWPNRWTIQRETPRGRVGSLRPGACLLLTGLRHAAPCRGAGASWALFILHRANPFPLPRLSGHQWATVTDGASEDASEAAQRGIRVRHVPCSSARGSRGNEGHCPHTLRTRVCICAHRLSHMHTCIHTHTYPCTCTLIQSYILTLVHTHSHTIIHTHTCPCTLTHILAYSNISMHTQTLVHAHTYTCTLTHIHTYSHLHMHTHSHLYTLIHAHTHSYKLTVPCTHTITYS